MKNLKDIREINSVEMLKNEYDLEKASVLARKLRLLIKEDDSLNR